MGDNWLLSILLAFVTGGGVIGILEYVNRRRELQTQSKQVEEAVWSRLNADIIERMGAMAEMLEFLEGRVRAQEECIRRQDARIRELDGALEDTQRELRETCLQRDELERKNAILEERVRLLEAQAGLTPSPVG